MELKSLALEFVNSEWYDGWGRLEDRLQSGEWRRKTLAAHQFPPLREPDSRTLAKLVRLRSLLREMIEGGEPGPAQIRALNRFLALRQWRYEVRRGRLDKVPAARDWRWFMACVAVSACELLFASDRRRLKVCPNPGCRWVFYDLTKGRTRRWCTPALCGNLDKVRRFRARKKANLAP